MEQRVQLKKTLKPHWVSAIALGSAIGWGCFILPAAWMNMAGPVGAIIGLLIGALLMIIIAVSYGYMIEKFPVSGGEFAYAYIGFGKLHAYICGWFLTFGYICIVALNASALALLGKFIFPTVTNVGFLYQVGDWEVYAGEIIIASTALLLFAFLNIKGATLSGKLQFIFCCILVSGIVLLTISMLLHPSASISNVSPLFKPEIPALTGIITIVAITPWAYVGFNNIPQAAEEFNFPPKKSLLFNYFCAYLCRSVIFIHDFDNSSCGAVAVIYRRKRHLGDGRRDFRNIRCDWNGLVSHLLMYGNIYWFKWFFRIW